MWNHSHCMYLKDSDARVSIPTTTLIHPHNPLKITHHHGNAGGQLLQEAIIRVAWTINEPNLPEKKRQPWMLCNKVIHCAGCVSANARPHQLLGSPGDGDCYLMAQNAVRWLALFKRSVECQWGNGIDTEWCDAMLVVTLWILLALMNFSAKSHEASQKGSL